MSNFGGKRFVCYCFYDTELTLGWLLSYVTFFM
jgi:hypothetical protein